MTSSMPKPLLPVVNRPIMEHVLRLLKRHGLNETVVTVQFLASLVKNYFGDGEELGMELTYANEEKPLEYAGSVKNAEKALKDDAFLVISGDALTDFDLTDLINFHRRKRARSSPCVRRACPARWNSASPSSTKRAGRALPGEADLGPGLLGHREHRDLRHGASRSSTTSTPMRPWTGPVTSSRS